MVDEPDFERKEQGRVYFGIWRIKRQFLANELCRVCIATANVHHIEKDGGKLQASIRVRDPVELWTNQFKGKPARTL